MRFALIRFAEVYPFSRRLATAHANPVLILGLYGNAANCRHGVLLNLVFTFGVTTPMGVEKSSLLSHDFPKSLVIVNPHGVFLTEPQRPLEE
jgi:hypothetical protein